MLSDFPLSLSWNSEVFRGRPGYITNGWFLLTFMPSMLINSEFIIFYQPKLYESNEIHFPIKHITNINYLFYMGKGLLLILALCLLGPVIALKQVTQSDFDGSFWFLQVYSGSCPECKSSQKQLENVQSLMKGIAKVGKLNGQSIPGLQLKKNPSYFLVKGQIQDYVEYKEKISKIPISKYILSEMQSTVKARHSSLFGGSAQKKVEQQAKVKPESKPTSDKNYKKQNGVIVLTDKDFESVVLSSDEAWFVEFYSPSCGHCRSLQPEYDKLPGKMGKKVNIAKIDAAQNRQMAQKYQIKGFPTLLFFTIDEKQTSVPYQGQRTAEAMGSWLQTQKIGQEKMEFMKLTKQAYNKECNKNIVCLIFILDNKSQLKKQLNFIEDVMEDQNGKPLRFFYTARLNQFESRLMIEDRQTPTLVSIWDSINSYKIYNGQQNAEQVNSYIGKIMERKSWIKMNQKIVSSLFAAGDQL